MKTRMCNQCKLIKDEELFYLRKDRSSQRTVYCKDCLKIKSAEGHRRLKIKAVDYAGGSCRKCDYSRYVGALEFHHLEPEHKDFTISQWISRHHVFDERLKKEIDKCILLCSNCHKETHATDKGIDETYFRTLKISQTKTKNLRKPRQTIPCVCGNQMYLNAKKCIRCEKASRLGLRPKIVWPSVEEILDCIKSTSAAEYARKLGVSRNNLIRHLKCRGKDYRT